MQAKYTDGRGVLASNLVQNLCNGRTYTVSTFPVEEGGEVTPVRDADDEHVGSDVRESGISASFSLISPSVDDQDPDSTTPIRNGHTLFHRDRYYTASKIKAPYTLKQALVITGDAIHVKNPIISNMLSLAGQHKEVTAVAGAAYSFTPTAVNVRTGATASWALHKPPAGFTINASTGVVTHSALVAGRHKIEIVCTDTLANKKDRVGFGVQYLTVA